MSSDEIEEIIELRTRKQTIYDQDLFARLFDEKRKNLRLLRDFRFIYSKMLFTKLVFALYLYSETLDYYLDKNLKMPESMARNFGPRLGKILSSGTHHFWLFVIFALWLTIAL